MCQCRDVDAGERLQRITKRILFFSKYEVYVLPKKATKRRCSYCVHPFSLTGEPHLLCADIQKKCSRPEGVQPIKAKKDF